jgi:sucrose-phosphate synthase
MKSGMRGVQDATGLYLAHISPHGLIRGHDLELGRDPDTGGQTKYVVELARAIGGLDDVGRVELLTRLVEDDDVGADYARPVEDLSDRARIVRLPAGPEGYIRKEELWDHLDGFADNAVRHFRDLGRTPDVIHAHYADAGYVGTRLSNLLGVPLVFTGHSLGRVKRGRLIAQGAKRDEIEERYHLSRRIEAEEETLANADLVVASTRQEIEEQYDLYRCYRPEVMAVIPPGTDLVRFHPPHGDEAETPIAREIRRFLRDPEKPMVLALSRPDERKNVAKLVDAFGRSEALRELANLVLVVGNRDDLRDMDRGPRRVIAELLLLVDVHDLYGSVAIPKHHHPDDVSVIYRLAAASRGVFVNPALTEPFGLTLIEAAATGLPIVATEDGGPQDIVASCRNGRLVDPLDADAMAEAILDVLRDPAAWEGYSVRGLDGVRREYSWQAHGRSYLERIRPVAARAEPAPRPPVRRGPILYHDRALFTDLDQNLLADPESIPEFVREMRAHRKSASFGVATGRRLDSALTALRRHRIPMPDVLITSVGTEIFYAPDLTIDRAWTRHIDHHWEPAAIRRLLADLPGLALQEKESQSRFKISYYIDPEAAPPLEEIHDLLRENDIVANAILSFAYCLDVIPARASKGFALRYFADQWEIPLERILAAGGSGADEDMMRGNTLAVVVANRHEEELGQLADVERIYFAKRGSAAGILEAIDHYDFFGDCRAPEDEE